MLKIIKQSTYDNLLEIEKLYKESFIRREILEDELRETRRNWLSSHVKFALTTTIRRAIVGRKGSGKTELVKSFLRKMHPNRYFIIDRNSEYVNFPETSKICFNTEKHKDWENWKNVVIEAIKANLGKLIILEDFGTYNLDKNRTSQWFFDAIGSSEFIIVGQSTQGLSQDVFHNIDLIYNTGCMDSKWHDKIAKQFPGIYYNLNKRMIGEIITS